MSYLEHDTLYKMYEYQQRMNSDGKEYAVKGARARCGWGTKSCVLNLPKDHGVRTADNRPLITYSDCHENNIDNFGTCRIAGEEIPCKPNLDYWDYNKKNQQIYNSNSLQYEYAVTVPSFATCKKEGYDSAYVHLETSGQVVPDYSDQEIKGATEIKENKLGEWKRGSDTKDFLGHFNVVNPGIYNFAVYMDDQTDYVGGTIFVYYMKRKTLKYYGASKLSNHKNDKRVFFDESKEVISGWTDTETGIFYPSENPVHKSVVNFTFTIWADLILEKGDCYLEIDCPNINSLNFKMIGNQDQKEISLSEFGGACWEESWELLTETYCLYDTNRVINYILYLDENYTKTIRTAMSLAKSRDTGVDWLGIGKTAVITGIGLANTELGIFLTILDLVFTNCTRSEFDELFDVLDMYAESSSPYVRLEIYTINPLTPDASYSVSPMYWNINIGKVFGNKYHTGKFSFMPPSKYAEEYEKSLENIQKNFKDEP